MKIKTTSNKQHFKVRNYHCAYTKYSLLKYSQRRCVNIRAFDNSTITNSSLIVHCDLF